MLLYIKVHWTKQSRIRLNDNNVQHKRQEKIHTWKMYRLSKRKNRDEVLHFCFRHLRAKDVYLFL